MARTKKIRKDDDCDGRIGAKKLRGQHGQAVPVVSPATHYTGTSLADLPREIVGICCTFLDGRSCWVLTFCVSKKFEWIARSITDANEKDTSSLPAYE